jgi:hypothetical protein
MKFMARARVFALACLSCTDNGELFPLSTDIDWLFWLSPGSTVVVVSVHAELPICWQRSLLSVHRWLFAARLYRLRSFFLCAFVAGSAFFPHRASRLAASGGFSDDCSRQTH